VSPTNIQQRRHIERLVRAFPELQHTLDEHLKDNDELLPHLFYGDVSRWFVERCLANDERAAEFAQWLEGEFEGKVDSLEDQLQGRESVDNLISVSFVENLPWPPDRDADRVAAVLGPRWRRQMLAMRDWRPDSN
jgi:hypothetical protein